MAMKGVLWNGKYFVRPQASSRVDSSALNRSGLGSDNRLAILADMVGFLAPKVPTKVTNVSQALALIHPDSKEARIGAQLAFDPSPGSEVRGASEVYLVSVNPSVQASITLQDATPANVCTLTSYLYGVAANQLKVKVEAGTTGKKITLAYGSETEVHDNLIKNSFSILYTGAGSAAAMTIDLAAGTLVTACTGAAGDNLNLSFATYPTIQALLDAINATGKYTVVALTDAPTRDLCSKLDAADAVDILGATYTHTASLQYIVDTLNTKSGYVSATRTTNAGTVPANLAYTYLSSGSNGTIENQDWQDALDALKGIDIQQIAILEDSASIHTLADSHADYMSGPEGKNERRVFVGGSLQTWVSEANRLTAIGVLKTAARNLNSDRTMHVGLGCYLYDEDGVRTLYPGYILACAYAGMAAGQSPEFPLTRKYLRVLGLEVDLRDGEIDDLIEAGVAVPMPDRVNGAGYVVSRQVTTWGQTADLYRIEFSVGRASDYVARQVRNRHEEFIGKTSTEALDASIINATNSVLDQAKRLGIIRSYDPKATTLRIDGTIYYVDYSAIPALPVNFLFSTYHLAPLNLTIQL